MTTTSPRIPRGTRTLGLHTDSQTLPPAARTSSSNSSAHNRPPQSPHQETSAGGTRQPKQRSVQHSEQGACTNRTACPGMTWRTWVGIQPYPKRHSRTVQQQRHPPGQGGHSTGPGPHIQQGAFHKPGQSRRTHSAHSGGRGEAHQAGQAARPTHPRRHGQQQEGGPHKTRASLWMGEGDGTPSLDLAPTTTTLRENIPTPALLGLRRLGAGGVVRADTGPRYGFARISAGWPSSLYRWGARKSPQWRADAVADACEKRAQARRGGARCHHTGPELLRPQLATELQQLGDTTGYRRRGGQAQRGGSCPASSPLPGCGCCGVLVVSGGPLPLLAFAFARSCWGLPLVVPRLRSAIHFRSWCWEAVGAWLLGWVRLHCQLRCLPGLAGRTVFWLVGNRRKRLPGRGAEGCVVLGPAVGVVAALPPVAGPTLLAWPAGPPWPGA